MLTDGVVRLSMTLVDTVVQIDQTVGAPACSVGDNIGVFWVGTGENAMITGSLCSEGLVVFATDPPTTVFLPALIF